MVFLFLKIPRPTPQHKNKIDRNNSEFDNSKSSQSDRNEEPFGSNGPNETDMNTNEQKSRTAPLQVDDGKPICSIGLYNLIYLT